MHLQQALLVSFCFGGHLEKEGQGGRPSCHILLLLWVLACPVWTTLANKADLLRLLVFTLDFIASSPDDLSQSFGGFLSWRNRVGFSGLAVHPTSFSVPGQPVTSNFIIALEGHTGQLVWFLWASPNGRPAYVSSSSLWLPGLALLPPWPHLEAPPTGQVSGGGPPGLGRQSHTLDAWTLS